MNRNELVAAINLQLLCAQWTPDHPRSLSWEGTTMELTPERIEAGKHKVTMSLRVDARHGANPLQGIQLQAQAGGGIAIAPMTYIAGSESTYRCAFELTAAHPLKFELL